MFPSSGLFAHISCPFVQRGLCERPHCLYKHAAENAFGGLFKSSSVVDSTGNGSPRGAPVKDQSTDECLHELARINKEIETVRHEVEQEQWRLSCYQTAEEADGRSDEPVSKCENSGPPSSKDRKTHAQARKYVVDESKPRTDLEYDPLSNFSAALRSYSSPGKERKVKNREAKRPRHVHFDQNGPSTHQAQMSRSPSPELLDESTEDCVLVIDVPLSPERTSGQDQRSVAVKSSQVKIETASLNSPPTSGKNPEVVNVAVSSSSRDMIKVHNCYVAKNDPESPTCDDHKESENADGPVVDLSGYIKALESECQNTSFQSAEAVEKTTKPADFPITSDQQGHNSLLELAGGVEKGKLQRKSTMTQEQAEAAQGSSQFSYQNVSSVQSHSGAESSESTEQLLHPETEAVIVINSSSDDEEEEGEEEELSCAEMELSDSDPMEECYRIFMEANGEETRNEEHPDMSAEPDINAEKPKVNTTIQALPGKKRVAHEATNLEQPLAKSRPQPQVLVPLREPAASGFGSRPSVTSKIQQVQQRASMLTASVKASQAFVCSTSQAKLETQSAPSAPGPEILQPDPAHSAYLNYIPVGTAVIEVGNNLHLILPQGSFPLSVASTSSPVTSVLTPVNQVHPSLVSVKQPNNPPAVTVLPRYRSAAPVLIAAPARRPVLGSAFSSTLHSTAAPTTSQAPVQAAAKLRPMKRKLKQETMKDKVPHDVRQRYVNMFTEEFLKTTPNVNDAFEKALAEERSVYNRSVNRLKYLSVAVNALKRLKNQNVAAKSEKKVQSQRPKGNIPFNMKKLKQNDLALYESLKDYVLTEEKMIENNYPVQHPEKPGSAVLFADKKVSTDPLKRICCRCGATYSVSQTGKHIRKEECNYHYGKGVEKRVPGGVETRYSCCQGIMGTPGCQVFKLHVHDSLSLDGFVSTAPRCPSDTSCPGVYSLDCEMCYTLQGLELSRVTVVNSSLQVIYDTFVRPDNEVIDCDTRFSGIGEEDLKGNHTPLRKVQETLLSFISADTILVGHELETDLCLLKLLHGMVVDTSVVFPHRLGPPYKLSLNTLTAEHLRRIIQESVCGHDTAEDAAACMELMLWKMKEDGKLKK
ncbi:RNA exonuclease 1 homolog isoform X2 [Kryptolebias marmoratus]|uniref:RNA exonuclease 1 homolog isoform X2 n=1 Tax=Kryptolebias marmoratus TaxID=37003 RepID=UPI0007F89BE6|nr:RNA exonuclease 1 homolog isoform X2 [Kryptolebias marmoratus]